MKYKARIRKLENEINADLITIYFENGEIMKLTNEEILGLIHKLQDKEKVFPAKPIKHNYGGSLIELIYSVQLSPAEPKEEIEEDKGI